MIPISQRDFDRAVAAALESIPDEFRSYLDNVVIETRAAPDAALLREHEVPDDILGLYVGCPLTERSVSAASPLPDRVLIFRDNLVDMCESYAELIDEIRITVLHEIGHHFGLDEDRLAELGYD